MPHAKPILLITGASGYLGQHLVPKAAEQYDVYAAYHTQAEPIRKGQSVRLDLADQAEVNRLIRTLTPDAIIHAASVNPGRGPAADMMRINRDGSHYVAEAAAAVGARLIHLSTDAVHNGQNAPYPDDATPSPLNDYGRSKATAEAQVMTSYPQAVMVRTSLIYGLTQIDRGTESFVKHLESDAPLILFNDVIRQPIHVETLVQALLKLVHTGVFGSLNIAGRQALTREAFGRRMLAHWGIDAQDRVQPSRAADVSDTIALDLRLLISRAEYLLQMTFPGVDEVLSLAN